MLWLDGCRPYGALKFDRMRTEAVREKVLEYKLLQPT
jgi:hypothetical protein